MAVGNHGVLTDGREEPGVLPAFACRPNEIVEPEGVVAAARDGDQVLMHGAPSTARTQLGTLGARSRRPMGSPAACRARPRSGGLCRGLVRGDSVFGVGQVGPVAELWSVQPEPADGGAGKAGGVKDGLVLLVELDGARAVGAELLGDLTEGLELVVPVLLVGVHVGHADPAPQASVDDVIVRGTPHRPAWGEEAHADPTG